MRILVIDDDRDIRESLKSSLEADCFAVDTAGDGETGSYMAREHDYDLILLDYIMPKKTGFVVCRDVRDAGKTTPIIVLSVQSETDDKVDFLNAGADDYLSKPFSYEELRSRIRAIMRRPLFSLPHCFRSKTLLSTPRNTRHEEAPKRSTLQGKNSRS